MKSRLNKKEPMRFDPLYQAVQDAKRKISSVHQLVYSNKLDEGKGSKKKKDLFKGVDKKLNDVLRAILKTQDMKPSTYKYIGPQDRLVKAVDTDFIKSNLSVIKDQFKSLQREMEKENYKIVNAHANTYTNLKGAEKALFTKASSDLEALVELF